MSEPTPEIRHSVLIRAPRERVWAALTTAKGLDGWWGTRGSEIDLRPGGKIVLRWRAWGPEQDTTTVEFDLEERDTGTLVRLREHGFAPNADGRKSLQGNSIGWGVVATLMKFYVEHGLSY